MARKKFFLPTSDTALLKWLQIFSANIPHYASKYNIAPVEVEKVQKGAAHLIYWITVAAQMKSVSKSITAYKNGVRDGLTHGVSTHQPANVIFSPPQDMGTGIIPFMLSIAGRIKKHEGYSATDGKALGIEGTERLVDMAEVVPVIKIKLAMGQPVLVWKKGIFDGIKIRVNRNYNPLLPAGANDTFEFLAIDLQPNFTDNHALPPFGTVAVWAYTVTYMLGDKEVGLRSQPVMVTVIGTP